MTDFQGVVFPLDTFREAAIHLRRPFTESAVKWKVQANLGGDKGALIVGYIDARLVVERLNLIVPHLWHDQYAAVDGNTLRCDLTVDGITRSDVGKGQGPEAAKAAYSDALKRAAVKFGVGVSLYAIPQVTLWADAGGGKFLDLRGRGEKKSFVITDAGVGGLRKGYSTWLAKHGEEAFGPALDHGDVEVSVGDPDVVEQPDDSDDTASAGALVEGERADELRAVATTLHADIAHLVGRAKFPKGQFDAGLESAGTSLEALESFVGQLQARLEGERAKQPVAA